MDFVILQKIDDDGYFLKPIKFFLQKDCNPSKKMIELPLPEDADIENNFYRWTGTEWHVEPKPKCAADLVGVVVSHKSQTAHDQEMRALVQRFGSENGYRINRGDELEWIVEKIPDPTPEEVAEKELQAAKNERANAVSEIVVEVDGMVFDGDEDAQTRMGRTVAAAVALGVDLDTYTQTWVLADNSVAQPTISQIARALKLAGKAQTELWTKPYEGAEDAAS